MIKNYILKIRLVLAICFLSTVLFSSCGKEGPEGPQGKDGIKGQQGVAGADGSTILNGNGAPAPTLGNNGDYYLDKTAVAIYGPKTANGWGDATSLKGDKGETGPKGKDGATLLNGTGAPATSLGAEGDFYLDTQSMIIYGPKTTAGWGSGVSLKAPEANGVKVVIYKNQVFQNVDGYSKPSLVIKTDAKYDDIYENGLVLAYGRKSGDNTVKWQEEFELFSDDSSKYLVGATAIKDGEIIIVCYSLNMSESEIKTAKFDIKVVFIPASSVEIMASKNVDTKNLLAVSRFLRL